MTTEATTRKTGKNGRTRSATLLSLAVGTALAAVTALPFTAQQADAAVTEKIVFASNLTTGTGVDNPTGDYEIFKMNPDGTGVRQLTFNTTDDQEPTLSPDGKKIAYESDGVQPSNQDGDHEVYVMNALDGSGNKNLSDNGLGVEDYLAVFSPDGAKIAYESRGAQTSNPGGDSEIYRVNVLDGTGRKNLTNNGSGINDHEPDFSPDGTKIAYESYGKQTSNPEGDDEVYRMNALDGLGKKNLSNNGAVGDYDPDFSPDGTKIAYESYGKQTSNPEGDDEVYRMNALDGLGKKNLSNTGDGVYDDHPVFSPGGAKIAYRSHGIQTSNAEGDWEVYVLNTSDGKGTKNLSDTGDGVNDTSPDFSPDGTKIAYESYGKQDSNLEGDDEIYRMNALDGLGKKNLSDTGTAVYDLSPEWGR